MFRKWRSENRIVDYKFDGKNIPKASDRAFWDDIPNDYADAILTDAEKLIGFEYPLIKATDYIEFFRSGDRLIMEDKHFPRRTALCNLALAECIEHKGRFLDELVNVIFMICEETFWGLSAHLRNDRNIPNGFEHNLDLFAAETAADLALARYVLHDELEAHIPEIIKRLDREMEIRILTPFFTDHDLWWMGHDTWHVNNWCPWIISNMMTVLSYFVKDEKRKAAGFRHCMDILQVYIDSYPSDGGCDEGPSYWNAACAALFECVEQIHIATDGRINFYGEPLLRSMLDYIENVYIGEKYYANFADCPSKINSIASPHTYRFAKAVGNENVAAISAWRYKMGDIPKQLGRSGSLRRYIFMLMHLGEVLSYDKAPVIATENVMSETEILSARENDRGTGLYLAAKGGHNGESHNHNDVGSFIIYYDNKPVIIDVGSGEYTRQLFSSERYTLFFTRSDWHNVPTVNGICQSPEKNFRSSHFDYDFSEEKAVLSMGLESAYTAESGLDKLDRKIVLDRNEHSVTLKDSFGFKNDENEITENLILLYKPEIDNGVITLYTSDEKALKLTYDASKFEANLVQKNVKGVRKFNSSWYEGIENFWKIEFKTKCAEKAEFELTIKA